MEELYLKGKIRAIGVSNFSVTDIIAIIENCQIVPIVNQIAIYIGHLQDGLAEFCRQQNILVEAYSPLATGRILKSEIIREMAQGGKFILKKLTYIRYNNVFFVIFDFSYNIIVLAGRRDLLIIFQNPAL